MARNPSDHHWIETEEVRGSSPPWRQRGQQREPLNWPTAILGLGALAVLAFVVWVCGGVATEWIAR